MQKISRIQTLFTHDKAYIAYLTAGDGGIERTLEAALALIDGGVNMLEIGVPFSDPIADGPIIQRAAARSLAACTSLDDVLWLTKKIRQHSDIPLILFSYLNPILSGLQSDFLHDAKQAGIDGLLLVDCPMEESKHIQEQCKQNEIDLIYVITSVTPLHRIRKIHSQAQGFIYYACRKGTTGVRQTLPEDFEEKMHLLKSIVQIPVVVGFGISTNDMVNQVLEHADGVVVGSFFVKALEEGVQASGLSSLARAMFLNSENSG